MKEILLSDGIEQINKSTSDIDEFCIIIDKTSEDSDYYEGCKFRCERIQISEGTDARHRYMLITVNRIIIGKFLNSVDNIFFPVGGKMPVNKGEALSLWKLKRL